MSRNPVGTSGAVSELGRLDGEPGGKPAAPVSPEAIGRAVPGVRYPVGSAILRQGRIHQAREPSIRRSDGEACDGDAGSASSNDGNPPRVSDWNIIAK